jgi:hypothetical protein
MELLTEAACMNMSTLPEARLRIERRAAEAHAAAQASKAMTRYGHVMSFAGHEGIKPQPSEDQQLKDKYYASTTIQRQEAGVEADQALRKYGSLLTFAGHQGSDKADAKVLQKRNEAQVQHERASAESQARHQLHAYNLLRFNDEQFARKELARKRVALKEELGGGGRGRVAASVLSTARDETLYHTSEHSMQPKAGTQTQTMDAKLSNVKSADSEKRQAELNLQWNGKGIPRFG